MAVLRHTAALLLGIAASVTTLAAPPALRVEGLRLIDESGEPVRLRGVNVASLEWSSDGGGVLQQTVRVAIEDWGVNHIRLPLSQDRWFGKAPEQSDGGEAYRRLVDEVVEFCSARGVYVMADLHWSNAGEWGQHIGQHVMPDDKSVLFWRDIAKRYANHPAVLFDLYNEPHSVSWRVWRDGGDVTEQFGRLPHRTELRYRAVGMQPLLDAVREAGAKNVAIVGGLDYAYDLSGVVRDGPLIDNGGDGVLYANHAYPFKGDRLDAWEAKMAAAARVVPIIVSEFGSDTGPQRRGDWWRRPRDSADAAPEPFRNETGMTDQEWVAAILKALDRHGWHWTAWDLHPHAGPRLISDWDYTPTPFFGALVKASLHGEETAPAEASAP